VIHHADFAIPVTRELVVETDVDRPGVDGTVAGPVLALGWWVTKPGEPEPDEPTGTLYLVADQALPRPVWIAQARLTSFRVD
jgi:hypothetical protein